MFNGTAYLDRAVPRFAPAKFLALAFTRGPLIEPAPGSNCPGRIFWPDRSALASRFLAFCAAFAFARWRALALVMSSSPFLSLSQSLQTKQHTRARNRTARSARLVASPHSNHVEQAFRPQTGVGGGTLFSRTLPKYDRYAAALQSNRQRAARPNRILFNLPRVFT